MTTLHHSRTDTALDTLAVFAPIAPLIFLLGYSRDRAKTAWGDQRGFSHTVEVAIWTGIGLVAAVAIGAILYNALKTKATNTGTDIQNQQLAP